MYLIDREVKAKLGEMAIECTHPKHPFVQQEQIQPCSIDLRLSDVFWEPIGNKSINLLRTKLLELEPRYFWRRRVLADGETFTLKPGQIAFGRVYEKFTIPKNCAGRIEGRSSYARMGLGVHLSTGFINPGYRGHMPLQLVNHGPRSIVLSPYLPICQLMLIRLSDVPERLYGHTELQSKYMDDDGGPSYWWRDKRIKELRKSFVAVNVAERIQEDILNKMAAREPEIILRLEKFVDTLSSGDIENAESVLNAFSTVEEKRRVSELRLRRISKALFPATGSALAVMLLNGYFGWRELFMGIACIASFIPFRWLWTAPEGQYFGTKELIVSRKQLDS